jgi:uncharacterized damage-inducible protein DinB
MRRILVFALSLVVYTSALPAAPRVQQLPAAPNLPPAPKSGFRAEFLHDLDDVSKKIVSLAEAMPAEKYNWRPAPGVRSVSEVFMHIAGANYFLASFVGMKMPSYDTSKFEKIGEKPRVLEELRRSFDHLRTAALIATDADLEKSIKMFGNDTTERAAFVTALNHLHEHLGQAVAYARINGVVPPWSAKE